MKENLLFFKSRAENICYNRRDRVSIYLFLYFLREVAHLLESKFQSELILDCEELFPGCIILKNDSNYIQGFPDLLILYKNKWAALECKKSAYDRHRPNQDYYIDILDKMSYASFIYPENKKEVLDELQQTLRPRRTTRILRG